MFTIDENRVSDAMKYEMHKMFSLDMQYEMRAGSCWRPHRMKNKMRLGMNQF